MAYPTLGYSPDNDGILAADSFSYSVVHGVTGNITDSILFNCSSSCGPNSGRNAIASTERYAWQSNTVSYNVYSVFCVFFYWHGHAVSLGSTVGTADNDMATPTHESRRNQNDVGGSRAFGCSVTITLAR